MVLLNKTHVKLLLIFSLVWFKIEVLTVKYGKYLTWSIMLFQYFKYHLIGSLRSKGWYRWGNLVKGFESLVRLFQAEGEPWTGCPSNLTLPPAVAFPMSLSLTCPHS